MLPKTQKTANKVKSRTEYSNILEEIIENERTEPCLASFKDGPWVVQPLLNLFRSLVLPSLEIKIHPRDLIQKNLYSVFTLEPLHNLSRNVEVSKICFWTKDETRVYVDRISKSMMLQQSVFYQKIARPWFSMIHSRLHKKSSFY